MLTYNTVARNYVLIYSENDEVEETIDDKAHSDRKVNKEQFERYMRLKIVNAGFSNYRGYLRFKKEEDKRSQIAIDR